MYSHRKRGRRETKATLFLKSEVAENGTGSWLMPGVSALELLRQKDFCISKPMFGQCEFQASLSQSETTFETRNKQK